MTEKYLSPLVSCLTCREVKSTKGIFTHFIVSHTEEGNKRLSSNNKKISHLGTNKLKQISTENRLKYEKEPNLCICGSPKSFDIRNNKFCSAACAATNNNKNRIESGWKESEESRMRKSLRMKGVPQINRRLNYTRISFCEICGNLIRNKHCKTCSDECYSKLNSHIAIERIKKNKRSNFRRDKRSYLEESFEIWLKLNFPEITFEAEKTIKNSELDKWYFVDFYFPHKNLIVELDGKQHEKPKHKEADLARDNFIRNILKIDVFRISHEEYQSGIKIEQLKNLLN
jgi:very-short-patch-repair endonuclease